MNYSVHAVMYMYFALMNVASDRKEKATLLKNEKEQKKALQDVQRFKNSISAFAPLVTLMQISQMFVGIAVMALIYRDSELFHGTQKCYVRRASWFSGIVMYASYFMLFVFFAANKYCGGSSSSSSSSSSSTDKSARSKGEAQKRKAATSSVHRMTTRSARSAVASKDGKQD